MKFCSLDSTGRQPVFDLGFTEIKARVVAAG
jgi:hypothetical protein